MAQPINLEAAPRTDGYATVLVLREALTTLGLLGNAGANPLRQDLIDVLQNIATPAQRLQVGIAVAGPEPAAPQFGNPGPAPGPAPGEVIGNDLAPMPNIRTIADLMAENAILKLQIEELQPMDNKIILSSIPSLKHLPDLSRSLLEEIDNEDNERQKQLLFKCALTKKFLSVLTSIVNMKSAEEELAPISEDTLKAIVTGDLSKLKLEDLIEHSTLIHSLPPMDKDSTRYRVCLRHLIAYTKFFYPNQALKYELFLNKFLAKESGPLTWKIMLELEDSYRFIVTSSKTENVDFSSQSFMVLQEQFSQRCSKLYSDSLKLSNGKGKGNDVNADKPIRRCDNWNAESPGTPLNQDCKFGPTCKWKHECSAKQCRGDRTNHRRSSCFTRPVDAPPQAEKKIRTGDADKKSV
jgi:hypothetical protein